jgi:transposase
MTPKASPTRSGNVHYQRRSRRSSAQLEELQRRRLRAAEMFEEGARPAGVGRALGVSCQAACNWLELWKRGGVEALNIASRTGRFPKITDEQLAAVEAILLQGARASGYTTELWTLQRVSEVITRTTGVTYHPGHVWRLLRDVGWSRQRPTRRAVERDEAAIDHWVKHRWPAIKRGLAGDALGSSSKTRAGSA